MLEKFPCKQCILYAICYRPNSIVELIEKCQLLANSIISPDDALEIIDVLKPSYIIYKDKQSFRIHMNAEAIYSAARKVQVTK